LLVNGVGVQTADMLAARFNAGGTSEHQAVLLAKEANRVQRDILRVGAFMRVKSGLRHYCARHVRRALAWPGGARHRGTSGEHHD
jgi:hypothetical protein